MPQQMEITEEVENKFIEAYREYCTEALYAIEDLREYPESRRISYYDGAKKRNVCPALLEAEKIKVALNRLAFLHNK